MTNKNENETLYGHRIISWKQENSIYGFGDFNGIIIGHCPFTRFEYHVLKIENHGLTKNVILPDEDVFKNNRTSGKAFADYLIAEAKKLRTGDEEIVICDDIAWELHYMDEAYARIQKVIAENSKKAETPTTN